AHQDTEDDALIGVKSTARLFGKNSPQWLQGFLTLTIMLFGFAVLMVTIERSPASMAVALLGPLTMGWHMQWQLRQLDTEDPAVLLRLFRANRDTGLIPLLFFATAFFL
ncbi:MAG: 4-hydroxybenzoate octaprenyltransferase, partial [Pseudomonadota bacterium]|nr:4-hydroxybenzoate octaprenyltransferase [Pseudomonadota bacterium]